MVPARERPAGGDERPRSRHPGVGGRDAQADVRHAFRLNIHRILADGDTAVVQHSISAKTRAGEQYDNEYCWVYHCRDGKIAKIEEYADTHKAARIMKWEN